MSRDNEDKNAKHALIANKHERSLAAVLVCSVLCLVLGAKFYLGAALSETQLCNMTVMWYQPAFMHIQLNDDTNLQFPHYRLIAYGEEAYALELANGTFNGAPVLFIPGNAGSDRQVRSLGSVSYMKSKFHEHKYGSVMKQFNYFAVDFDEELSAFSGELLLRQLEYSRLAAVAILDDIYYQMPETQLIVVGHSMGGLIASRLPHFDRLRGRIALIITLATPHQEPVLPYDDSLFVLHRTEEDDDQVPIISIGGGSKDLLVPSHLTLLPKSKTNVLRLWNTAPTLQYVWASTDHLCIVWCNQLVTKTARAFFDLLDDKTLRVTKDQKRIIDVMRFHFDNDIQMTRGLRHYAELTHDMNMKYSKLVEDSFIKEIEINGSTTIRHEKRSLYDISFYPPLLILTDRHTSRLAFLCVKRHNSSVCHPDDQIVDLVPVPYSHRWRGIYVPRFTASSLLINADQRNDFSSIGTTVYIRVYNPVEYRISLIDMCNPFFALVIDVNADAIFHIDGFGDSVLRAITLHAICVEGRRNVEFLLASFTFNGRTQRQAFTTSRINSRDTMYIHHHTRLSSRPDSQATLLLHRTPHGCAVPPHITIRSQPLKSIYVALQINSFGSRAIANLLVFAIFMHLFMHSNSKYTIISALLWLLACNILSMLYDTPKIDIISTGELVVVNIFLLTLYLLSFSICIVIIKCIDIIYQLLLTLPNITSNRAIFYIINFILLLLVLKSNGSLVITIYTIYELLKLPSTASTSPYQRSTSLCLHFIFLILNLPSLILFVQTILMGKSLILTDSSRFPAALYILTKFTFNRLTFMRNVSVHATTFILIFIHFQNIYTPTWQLHAIALAPTIALL